MNELDITVEDLELMSAADLRAYQKTIRPRYRDVGLLEDAARENMKLINYYYKILDTDIGITRLELSKLEFEQGYVEFLKGEYDNSIKYFQDSADNAKASNDPVGDEVGRFRETHTEIFAGKIDNESAYQKLIQHLENLTILLNKTGSGLARSFVFNVRGRLFELAVDMENVKEAELRYKQFLEDESTITELKPGHENRFSRLRQKLCYEGPLAFLKQDYAEALEKYAQYLEVDLSEWGQRDDNLIDLQNKAQESSGGYLYAGKCLVELKLLEKAIEVFEAGLAQDPQSGNYYYQDKIRAEMDDLSI